MTHSHTHAVHRGIFQTSNPFNESKKSVSTDQATYGTEYFNLLIKTTYIYIYI
jgi:hypothetical protein